MPLDSCHPDETIDIELIFSADFRAGCVRGAYAGQTMAKNQDFWGFFLDFQKNFR